MSNGTGGRKGVYVNYRRAGCSLKSLKGYPGAEGEMDCFQPHRAEPISEESAGKQVWVPYEAEFSLSGSYATVKDAISRSNEFPITGGVQGKVVLYFPGDAITRYFHRERETEA